MIKTPYDLQNFIQMRSEYDAEPLSALTRGVHLHTIIAENEEIMDRIVKELKEKDYLLYE